MYAVLRILIFCVSYKKLPICAKNGVATTLPAAPSKIDRIVFKDSEIIFDFGFGDFDWISIVEISELSSFSESEFNPNSFMSALILLTNSISRDKSGPTLRVCEAPGEFCCSCEFCMLPILYVILLRTCPAACFSFFEKYG